MGIDETRPFQAMMHDGSFGNLDFQPAQDVVGMGGVADFAKLKEQYREKLKTDGRDPAQADRAKGAVIVMTQQFLVMGLNRGIVLHDNEQNKRAWEMCAKSGNAVGVRVGGERKSDREREKRRVHFQVEPLVRDRPVTPRLSEVAALSDRISDAIDKQRKTS